MDNDFEIEVQDETVEKTESAQLPTNFLTFGEIENDDVKVYIKQDVYKALEKLSASDTTKELGSILLGQYSDAHGKSHVVISQFIEAKYTDASASTLTFTHETWDYVHSRHAQRYPELKIIGWQHTHPNYGIFLSNYDMFIQENFFNLPFQVAYVIDPIQNIRGFFQWKNGKVEKLKGYYVYDEVGKPIKIEQSKVKKEEPAKKSSKAMGIALALLCAATVLLGCFAISLNNNYQQLLGQVSFLQTELDIQKATISNQETSITAQADTIEQLQQLAQTAPTEPADPDEVRFVAYTVVAGDTLYDICQAHGLDYSANKKIIMAVNGLTNPDQINVGQTLLLPLTNG